MKSFAQTVYQRLYKSNGARNWWPIVLNGVSHYKEEYNRRKRSREEVLEIALGAILTQNTAWKNVEKTLTLLKEQHLLDFESLSALSAEDLAPLLKPSGYFNVKARKIKMLLGFFQSLPNGDWLTLQNLPLQDARLQLLSVWGIGMETADSILLYGYDFPIFVIDAYTKRIFSRLGVFKNDIDYSNAQDYFHNNLEKDSLLYKEYHALLVEHAKNRCKTKPCCSLCPLFDICPCYDESTSKAQ